ncbi:Fic family protein [Agromyces flavus]|uniref:Fic family protein n=1 Tax=Agromyces flavus TaxID=589382 RepID=A0A1H1Q697_9MICO|nr:Fic family protein [Agromyces flavus]MCP2367796.1 Fic family protein [Agromyces flavus]GGI47256.1 Fic family protein [Agromyces flavus]SDS18894.1 Fic family protein [Agromyces flavus]
MRADVAEWPPVEYEARAWVRTGAEIASRRALRAASGPYRASVPPLIADRRAILSPEVLATADDASRELTRFDSEVGHITAPFAAILLRTESASSSEVERLTASAKQVALAELGQARSGNARLVVANVHAMNAAIDLADRLDEAAIIMMHRALLEETAPGVVGGWRSEQVWIGGGSISPHSAEFVPPHHDRVPQLMADMMRFVQRTDLPVLAHAALAHAQFETIHPFPDGNGRTGRALIQSMLRAGGVTENVAVPVSAGLLHNTEGYFGALDAYRAGRAEEIVDALSEASFAAVENGRALVADIREASARWNAVVTARAHSSVHRVTAFLLTQPVVNVQAVAAAVDVSEVAAAGALTRLEEAGVLSRASSGPRYRVWQADEILAALDAFAARARRRRRAAH